MAVLFRLQAVVPDHSDEESATQVFFFHFALTPLAVDA